MSLFQHSVLNKYLKEANQEEMKSAYQKLVNYFHNPIRQQNIRESKEEQFQEGFLRELFVDILGYTINPNPQYNLTTEFKNERGAKKADGAILVDGAAIGVIELKSTRTKDLESIRLQAFDYKANQQKCVYVITSNFEKVRFYINNAVEFEEFDLFRLEYEHFQILWLCLSKENLLNGIPLAIKEASILKEENITKQIYIDYSQFKSDLYNDLIKNNLALEIFNGKDEKEIKLTLFQKSQKLLDRFLFVFFGEDRGLLPPNSISKIIDKWNKDTDWGESKTLYSIYKQYFNFLNIGRPSRGEQAEIFSYNGGLFKPDEILDSITISNDVLKKNTEILSKYDFESEVDVNILGHIFENSLNEIEEIAAQIGGTEADLKKSKRKKDGVFYTPKYITKYIVENTIGKLCEEKKTELEIDESEYLKSRKGRTIKKLKELDSKLDIYRNWLLTLTICDPACGSGAFLNQALDFLIREHRYIDELKAKLLDVPMIFTEVENSILENNIYGVDINEESIEIAKLSLWLRTAQKGRKLTTLSNNIKCGNSLIDDHEVAGEKAFNWQNEFTEVFKNGGFDVVIGNPPYLRVQGIKTHFENESQYFEKKYSCATRRYDIYSLFIEKSSELIKCSGRATFILPHKFLVVEAGQGIRRFLSESQAVESIIHFGGEMIFNDASTYTCIITLTKFNEKLYFTHASSNQLFNLEPFNEISYTKLNENNWDLVNSITSKIIDKISFNNPRVADVFEMVGAGIDAGADDIFMLTGKIENDKFIGYSTILNKVITIEKNIVKPLLKGEDVKRYSQLLPEKYIIYPHYFDGHKTCPYEEEIFKRDFPLAYNYMVQFKGEMIERKIRKKTNPKYWFSLHRSRDISSFEEEKIITPEISLGTNMTLDTNGNFHNTKVYYIIKKKDIKEDNKYFLGILNSAVMWFYLKSIGYVLRGGYFTFKTKFLEPFPLPKLNNLEQQNPIIEKVDLIMTRTKDLKKSKDNFVNYMQSHFLIESFNNKLQNWHELVFGEFIIELNKAIRSSGVKELSKIQEMEWMEVFETKKAEAQAIKSEIAKTDSEIDKMVYELYGLTEEEIRIVEGE